MSLGHEIISTVLLEIGALEKFIEEGFDLDWMNDKVDRSRAAVFPKEADRDAFIFILQARRKNHRNPSAAYFKLNIPAWKLNETPVAADELIAQAKHERLRARLSVLLSSCTDLLDEDELDEVIDLAQVFVRDSRRNDRHKDVYLKWDSEEYDVEERMDRELVEGIPVGIDIMDDARGFAGWQRGELITIVGRAKACKTSHLIKSSLAAHEEGWRVMFVSFEIGSEPIADRLDAFAAGVNYLSYAQGSLTPREKERIRDERKHRGEDEEFLVIQPTGKYTIEDLEEDIDSFRPDVVYVDGFYFMTDYRTGKPGSNWEGHDNLAADLHEMAMRRDITTVVTHQVREKQARGGKTLDDNTMMGGTGLIMASNMVITADMDRETKINTLACSRTRTVELPTVEGTWNWQYSAFNGELATYGDEDTAGVGAMV